MRYQINPQAACWREGIFCVPKCVVEKSLKFADEIKLKILLCILNGAPAEASSLAQQLAVPEAEVQECLAFWQAEGILSDDVPAVTAATVPETPSPKEMETLPMATLTPRDIVALCAEDAALADLLRGAERVLAASLSNAMKSNLLNMVIYYGLPVPVVLTLLEYYKAERDNGKNMTTRTLQHLAREWAQEEINTLDAAAAKLAELNATQTLWSDVLALCALDFRKASTAQRKMLRRWMNDFSKEMIFFACNTMKKYTQESERSVKQVDNILKEWKRKGFTTPEEVKAQPPKEKKTAVQNSKGKLKGAPSFDIEKLKERAALNDDFDF